MMAGGAISWCSKQQSTVALSSTESEYVALSWTSREAVWLQRLKACMSTGTEMSAAPITLFEDNTAAALWAQNTRNHQRQKHIDICHHYIRDLVTQGVVQVVYIPTKRQLADCLTKPLGLDLFDPLTAAVMGERALMVTQDEMTGTNVAHDPARHVHTKTPA
jgi:hypothetical protein